MAGYMELLAQALRGNSQGVDNPSAGGLLATRDDYMRYVQDSIDQGQNPVDQKTWIQQRQQQPAPQQAPMQGVPPTQ